MKRQKKAPEPQVANAWVTVSLEQKLFDAFFAPIGVKGLNILRSVFFL